MTTTETPHVVEVLEVPEGAGLWIRVGMRLPGDEVWIPESTELEDIERRFKEAFPGVPVIATHMGVEVIPVAP